MTVRTLPFFLFLSTWTTGCLEPWRDEWNLATDSGIGVVIVDDTIRTDTTWTADNVYVLADDTLVYVEGTAILTIEPGTVVRGRPGSALIVSRDALIDARGEPDNPIVFTSDQAVRRPGDWGGVVLLGNAELNKSAPRPIEGIAGDEPRAQYGGTDEFDNCGALEYVRIEFAGFELTDGEDGNELNGLTLGGCGVNTFIRYVQVHRGLDDGIELFGGNVDLKFVVISGAGDDSLDWDEGWNGRVQFGVIQQLPRHPDPNVDKNGDEGFEGDGALDDNGVIQSPFSFPTIANMTILGSGDPNTAQNFMELKEGTAALMVNLLVSRQTGRGVNLEDAQTTSWYLDEKAELPLTIRDSLFYDVGATGTQWGPSDPKDDDSDGKFDELTWLQDPQFNNTFGEDPSLPAPDIAGDWEGDPRLLWIPRAGSVAAERGGAPPDQEFFDPSATYNGAIRPGSGCGVVGRLDGIPPGVVMAKRSMDSASLARRLVEDEFDRGLPNQPGGVLGLVSWLGIGGLFASVFIVCGGLGALIGGRELWLQSGDGGSEGLSPTADAQIAPVAPPPIPASADNDVAIEERPPPVAPEPVVVEPVTTSAPAVKSPPPPPPPAPKPEDDFGIEVETEDLIDPWEE